MVPERLMTTWSAASSTLRPRTGCGSPTPPSTRNCEDKLCLCAIEDCFSNRIVRYSIFERMRSSIVVAAVESAVARRFRSLAASFTPTGDRNSFPGNYTGR